LPISLGVRQSPVAKGTAANGAAALRSVSKEQYENALRRDDYTCRCCGFRSEKFQRVIPAEPEQKTADPFITVCSFCESCFNLDRAGMTGTGILIWLPEIGQDELHHIVRAAYVARASGGPVAALADRALEALRMRRTEVKKRLGSDDPLLLATAFEENLSAEDYAARAAKLDGIRFLPADKYLVRTKEGDVDQFPEMLSYWRSSEGPFAAFPAEKWQEMFEGVAAKG